MPKANPEKFTIQKVKRTRRKIFIAWHNGTEDRTCNSDENALPAFEKALSALAPLIATICHLQPKYALTDMRVSGVVMGSQGGGETVSIVAQKSLSDASKALNIVTPPRLLQHPSEPGSYTAELASMDAELVFDLIEAAKDYAMNKRAQGTLELIGGGDDDEAGDDDVKGETSPETAPLPLDGSVEKFPGSEGKPAKKRAPRKPKAGKK